MSDGRRNLLAPPSQVFRALLWEQWRLSRMELLIRTALAGAFVLLFSAIIPIQDESALPVLRGILLFVIGLSALFSGSWINDFDSQQLGFAYRLGFTRPIATRWLVIVPVCFSLIMSLLYFLGGALAVYLLTGLVFPLVGPAAIITCTVCLFIAGAWAPTRIDGRIVGMVGALVASLGWLLLRDYFLADPDPILLSIGKPGYLDLAWYEYLGLLAVGCASIAATIKSVDLQRHGEGLFESIFGSWWGGTRSSTSSQTAPSDNVSQSFTSRSAEQPRTLSFRNRASAQIWLELRRSAPMLLAACITLPATLFVFLCLDIRWEFSPRAWMGAMVVLPVVCQFLATDRTLGITHKQGRVWLSPFDATRPMRCDQMIGIKVFVVFGWSLCGFLTTVLFAGLYSLLSREYEHWLNDLRAIQAVVGHVSPVWWGVGMINLLFVFLSSTTLLFAQGLWMSRFPRVLMAGLIVLIVHCGIFAWDAGHDWPWLLLWKFYGYAIPVAIMVGCVIALVMAIRAGYLSKTYFCVVLGMWLIYAGSTLWLFANSSPPFPIPLMAYLFGVAALLVPLASAAFAPLAFAAHRHG